jgi:hypothetical protein
MVSEKELEKIERTILNLYMQLEYEKPQTNN